MIPCSRSTTLGPNPSPGGWESDLFLDNGLFFGESDSIDTGEDGGLDVVMLFGGAVVLWPEIFLPNPFPGARRSDFFLDGEEFDGLDVVMLFGDAVTFLPDMFLSRVFRSSLENRGRMLFLY